MKTSDFSSTIDLDRDYMKILEILAKAHREPTENDLIDTSLLLNQDVKTIRLFESGKDVNDGEVFVAKVDSVEGHRRVTLTKLEEGVKDE